MTRGECSRGRGPALRLGHEVPKEAFIHVPAAAVGRCDGPGETGVCSLMAADGVVACAGCRIAPTSAGPEHWLLWVPRGSRHCPLAWPLEAAY